MPTVEQLETMLEKDPDDVFLNYGLAMALHSAGRSDDALARLQRTLELDSHYVTAYFQQGQIHASLGDTDEARAALEQGMKVAEKVGDAHALGEMRDYLDMLG